MLGPSARQHVVVEHINDDAGQPPVFCREDPLAAMNRGMAIRERVNRSMHLNAGAQPIGNARVLEPLDATLDVVAEHVSQPQLVIVTSQKEVDQIVHGRSTLENARRYDSGLVPTTVPKCSRITAAEPKPASAATCSMARSVVSSSRCARRTRACVSHAAGVAPTCSRKRRLSVLVLIAARRAMTGSGSSRERFCSIHVSNGVIAPGASDGGTCSMNCACPPARSSGITASRATDAAMSAPRSRRTM